MSTNPSKQRAVSEKTDTRDSFHSPANDPAAAGQQPGILTDQDSRQSPDYGERIQAFMQLTGQIYWTTPADGMVVDMPYWREFTGQTVEATRGWGWLNAVHPEDQDRVRTIWNRAIGTGTLYETEYRLRRHDGVYRYFLVRAVPVREPSGAIREWMGVHTDITERKQLEDRLAQTAAESAVRAREQETLIEAIADAVYIFDSQGTLVHLNRVARNLFEMDSGPEIAVRSLEERTAILQPEDEEGNPIPAHEVPAARALRGEEFNGETTAEIVITHPNRQKVYLSESGAPIRDYAGNVTGAVIVTRDVTARRELEHRTRATLDGIIAIVDSLVRTDETISPEESVSQTARFIAELTRTVTGCRRASIATIDAATGQILPLTVVGLSAKDEARWWRQQQRKATPEQDELRHALFDRLRSGEVITLDVSKPPMNRVANPFNVKTMAIAPMLASGQLVGYLALDHAGQAHRYTQEEKALAGTVAQLAAIVIERARLVREQRTAESREMALREANRRMDEFLSVASHELRTPLTTIRANVQLAERRLQNMLEDPEFVEKRDRFDSLHTLLARAERQTALINRLVSDLLDVSRIQANKLEMRLEASDLIPVIREAVNEQRQAWPGRRISLDAPEHPVQVYADADRIGQVVTNYLTNALKYSASTEPVEVTVDVSNPEVHVSVRDRGPGLPLEQQKRIWERFHTAPGIEVMSGSGVGLGLGLYITKTIVQRHGGKTGVESTVGEGSTFWFTLPVERESLEENAG